MNKSLRKIPRLLSSLVLILGLATSCSAPWSEPQIHEKNISGDQHTIPEGFGRLNLVFTDTLAGSRLALPEISLETASYRIQFTHSNGTKLTETVSLGDSLAFTMIPGDWNLDLLALNSTGDSLYNAASSFTVIEGSQISVPLTLARLEGTGNFTIYLSWDIEAPAGSTLVCDDSIVSPVSFELSPGQKSYPWEKTATAGYHRIHISIRQGDETLAGAVETLLILADKETISSVHLGASNQGTSTLDHPFPDFLGAIYTPEQTTFRIWSPDHSDVKVNLSGTEHSCAKRSDYEGYTNIYEIIVPGNHKNKEYSFYINNISVRDPYGAMVKPNQNVNIIMDLANLKPTGGWTNRPSLEAREDAVIYEVHIRDFTIDNSWNGTANHRGRFPGMVETGTTHGGYATGMDHLKALGVTHVQLLPFYDFATEHYNWGYDPKNWNVPEEQYSLAYAENQQDYEGRIREVQNMVNEFHRNGIRVIMDVVYNHTYGNEMFENITSKYFTGTNDSGCGNGINTGNPMVSRTIRDSLEFWTEIYGIDGFRFDLIGIFHYNEVKNWGEYLNNSRFPDRNLLIYGEPWAGYFSDPNESLKVRYGTTRHMASGHIGVFNGGYREAIKGNNDGVSTAYMFNNVGAADSGWAIYDGFRGSPYSPSDIHGGTWGRNYAADPEQSINYISAHDNFGLWDKVYLTKSTNVIQNASHQVTSLTPPASLDYPKRIVHFGTGIVLTSQGIPFIHGGDEILRTKTNNGNMGTASSWNYGDHGGTHNTYNAPDSFNSFKWNWRAENDTTFTYFKDLIALRKTYPGLRMQTNGDIETYLNVSRLETFAGQVITGHHTHPSDTHKLFVVLNSGDNQSITLPAGTWTQIADANGKTNISGKKGAVTVEGTAVTIFAQER